MAVTTDFLINFNSDGSTNPLNWQTRYINIGVETHNVIFFADKYLDSQNLASIEAFNGILPIYKFQFYTSNLQPQGSGINWFENIYKGMFLVSLSQTMKSTKTEVSIFSIT